MQRALYALHVSGEPWSTRQRGDVGPPEGYVRRKPRRRARGKGPGEVGSVAGGGSARPLRQSGRAVDAARAEALQGDAQSLALAASIVEVCLAAACRARSNSTRSCASIAAGRSRSASETIAGSATAWRGTAGSWDTGCAPASAATGTRARTRAGRTTVTGSRPSATKRRTQMLIGLHPRLRCPPGPGSRQALRRCRSREREDRTWSQATAVRRQFANAQQARRALVVSFAAPIA
jgi:hypothetical protein